MRILALLGFGWSKWITVEENKVMIQERSNPFTGYFSSCRVLVDVQKTTNNLTGRIKYKNIIR